jgi:N6-adenosine-specific RNA methylase IME4
MSSMAKSTLDRATTSKRYRTLLADPAWKQNAGGFRGSNRYYDLMSVEDICALPVGRLAAPDAHLWLWVTNGTLFAGQQVIEAWGFTYKSCLTWVKPRFGLGIYLRSQTEHLLFAVRGRAPIRCKRQGTWMHAPVLEHSRKPDEQYAVIERCSPGPYLELFARRRRAGWDAWGKEVDSDVEL